MGKLKIGFVLDDTLDTPDGVQQYILTLGRWLVSQGHEIHYLVGQTERSDIPNVHSIGRNVKVRFNGNGMSTPLPASKKAIQTLLDREKFDILHVQMPYSPFMAGRVINAAPADTAIVGTFHIAPHSTVVRIANQLLGKMVRKSLRRFDTLLSVSQAAADFGRQTFGVVTTILPNVVTTQDFAEAMPFSEPEGQKIIVYLGRLEPRKGCSVLLEAVNLLSRKSGIPAFRLIVCGRGPLDGELKQYVSSHGLEETVEFTGFVSEVDKARYLKTADIAVFPSVGGESFGIVLLEAMAAGHPVILAADNPGYHTVMEPRPEQLFPVRDPESLADVVTTYLTDQELRSRSIDWQKQYIAGFDVAVVGLRLVARYMQALRSRQGVR